MHERFGAAAFVTCPLEVAAGVMGTLSAAGGPDLDTASVQLLAARLAEVLLRKTTESLLQVTCQLSVPHQDALSRFYPLDSALLFGTKAD